MTYHTFTSGIWDGTTNPKLSDSLNENFSAVLETIHQVYTGTGWNVSQTGVGSSTASYETTAITNTSLTDKTYIKVQVTYSASTNIQNASGQSTIAFDIKETGGAYGTGMGATTVTYCNEGTIANDANSATLVYLITVTSGMRTNGAQVRISTAATTSGSNTPMTGVSNIQTIISLVK